MDAISLEAAQTHLSLSCLRYCPRLNKKLPYTAVVVSRLNDLADGCKSSALIGD